MTQTTAMVDARRRCSEMNARLRRSSWKRWYYAQRIVDNGQERVFIEVVENLKAEEVMAMRDGKPPRYNGWSDARIAALHDMLRNQLRLGMTDSEFGEWRQRESLV